MPEPELTNPNPEPVAAPTPPAEPAPVTPTLLSQPEPQPPAEATPPTPTVITEPIALVKPDGTFIDGWKDKLPEEIRNEECLNLVTDFPEMVKQFVNQRKAIGKNKVSLPGENADESELNAFYEAIGRPKTETGYKAPEIPEELGEIFSEERLIRAKERAYKLGATQKQFNDYLSGEIEEVVQTIKNEEEAVLKATRNAKLNAEKELRAELGAAYDERMHAANRLITEGIPKETDRLDFIEKYGNDVTVIRLLSTVAGRMSEHTALIGELTGKTTTDVQTRITAIEQNPEFRNINSAKMSRDERQQLTDELRGLYKQLHPVKKTG